MLLDTKIFKPSSILRHFQNASMKDGRFLEAFHSAIQGVGRMGRKTKEELQNPSIPSKRVLFLISANKFIFFTNALVPELQKTYKKISIVDLNQNEKILYFFRNKKDYVKYYEHFCKNSKFQFHEKNFKNKIIQFFKYTSNKQRTKIYNFIKNKSGLGIDQKNSKFW
jgi:hypothetical protein